MGDVWIKVDSLLQRNNHDIGNTGCVSSSVQNIWTNDGWSHHNWQFPTWGASSSGLSYFWFWYQKCYRLDPDGINIDMWSNSISWCGCRVTSIWKFLTLLPSKCKLFSLVNTASSGKETDTYMTPCQQLPSKCSLPLIVSLCTAGIIILTFRVPWRPLLSQQKMTLCRTGRPYKNVERTGKWISEEGTRFMWFWSSMKLIFMIQTSKVHY